MSQQHARLRTMAEQLAGLVLAEHEMSPGTRADLERMVNALANEADIAHDAEMRRVPPRPVRPAPRPWWRGLRA